MKIAGKDVSLFVAVQASPQVLQSIGCSRTCILTTQTDIAGISTIGSGIWKEFKGLSMNWNVSVDGLATVDENTGLLELRQLQIQMDPIFIDFQEVTNSVEINYTGYAIITSVQSNGTYNDVETYSVQLQGTGELFNATEEANFIIDSDGGFIIDYNNDNILTS